MGLRNGMEIKESEGKEQSGEWEKDPRAGKEAGFRLGEAVKSR